MSHFKAIFTRLSAIAPQNAAPNVSTRKPGTSAEASSIMRALMMSQKIPNVTKVSGNVTIFRNRPTVALMKPIATAAMSAASGPLTVKPGTSRETIQIANALNIQ